MSVLDNALEALGAGLNVHPPKEDGSKAPDALEWASRQNVMATESEVLRWYANGRTGLGLICGKVSRGLELFEFEGRAVEAGIYNDFLRAAQAAGLGELVERITAGYCESTPTGGVHHLSFCEETATTKLARRPATEGELAENPDDRFKVLIETKGEGGYVIVAPSSGTVHPTGEPWELISGGFGTIATITREERAELHRLARSFDRMPPPPRRPPRPDRPITPDGLRPGDDYNLRGDWHELLEAHGWRSRFTTAGGNEHWTRPGKETGTSATVNESGEGVLYVFSSSTPFDPDTAYDRFGAYAVLEHGGDHRAAATALRAAGYGQHEAPLAAEEPPPREAPDDYGMEDDLAYGDPGGDDDGDPGGDVHPVVGGEHRVGDSPSPWPKLGPAALHGLAGRLVATIGPHSEADPVALLMSLLTAFGAAVGAGPRAVADGADHPARLFTVLVGATSRGRKGTAWAQVRRIMAVADPYFTDQRILGGLASGEGLVAAVSDGYEDRDGDMVGAVEDKRTLILEPEYARVLKVCARESLTLSALLRDAWDRGNLRVMTRKDPLRATGAHIAMVGHVTTDELRRTFLESEAANGFGNRFLFAAVRRSKRLPAGGNLDDEQVHELGKEVAHTLALARKVGILRRTAAAEELWEAIYNTIDDEVDGMVGALSARAEAQMLRLSVLYALLDGSHVIDLHHLQAAEAVWNYAEATVSMIYGDSSCDEVVDKLLPAIRRAGAAGLDRQEQRDVFSRNVSADRLALAREWLERKGLVVTTEEETGGRPRHVSRAVDSTQQTTETQKGRSR